MRAPSTRLGAPRSSTSRLVVTVRLRSALGSRSVRNTVVVPGRRVICATWPSTQTHPSLPIQAPIFWLTTRTGHGCSGGYCAGVDRAVQTVEEALKLYGPPVYVRKEIVHNRHVVTTLEARGAIFVEETDEVPEGSIVIFSAHGVAPEVYEQARARSLKAIDATCPLVTKVHQEAKRFAAGDYDILLIGHEGHEEVIGTAGEAPTHVQLVDGPDAVDQVTVRDPSKVVWLSQTTLSVDETMQTVDRLRTKLPLLQAPPSDDICYATQNRQEVVKEIAPSCDVVIVVGSQNSSNSQRLREVAVNAGARAGYLVDYEHEIREEWLAGATTVGVTSGASVPDE